MCGGYDWGMANDGPGSTPTESGGGRGALQTDLLLGNNEFQRGKDLKLTAAAVNLGWNIPADARPELVERLREIVRKRSVPRWISGGEGGPIPVQDEERADVNSIRAGSVLVSMDPPTAKHEHDVKGTILAAVLPANVMEAI